jgi:hypothetical protein
VAIAVTTNHATAVCQSEYQPIITSPSPRRGRKRARLHRALRMIIWHNDQLHSIVFSGTKQIIFSFRLGLVASPATCYLAPWQWPVTAGRPPLSRSRGAAKLRAWGPRARAPTDGVLPTARPWRLLYRTKAMPQSPQLKTPGQTSGDGSVGGGGGWAGGAGGGSGGGSAAAGRGRWPQRRRQSQRWGRR